jgi:Zn-dependent protease
MSENESIKDRIERLKKEKQAQVGPSSDGISTKKKSIIAGSIAFIILLLTKFKFVIIFLLTKAKSLFLILKIGPAFKTIITMSFSIMIYAKFYGLKLAGMICLLILVHEMGHVLAAKIMKIKVSAPTFLPFFGAYITMKEKPRSLWEECIVGFGGPIAGLAGGLLVLAIGLNLDHLDTRNLFIITAWFTFIINFFNLIPVWGLDGDRMSKSFSFKSWVNCALLLLILSLTAYHMVQILEPIMLMITAVAFYKAYQAYKKEKGTKASSEKISERIEQAKYSKEMDKLSDSHYWKSVLLYFGLCICLTSALVYSEVLRSTVKLQ